MLDDKRILLAEPDTALADILRSLLLAMGTKVTLVSQGSSLIESAAKQHPDLVIIDSDISGIDAFKLSETLKSDFLTSYIPIILLIEKKQIRKKMLQVEQGIDDYIIKPPDPIDLEIRIEMAIRRTEHQVRANALTKLPGSREIEKVINERVKDNHLFSFFYIDINNFKSFNDKYGYVKGDDVIMQSAHIISDIVKTFGAKNDFVGHIGGDDFVVVTIPENEEIIAKGIIRDFDRLMPLHYAKDDQKRGYVRVKDRTGKIKNAPLMGISIAVINNRIRKIQNIIELTEIAFEIKKYLKTIAESSYLIDRRSKDQGKQSRQEEIDFVREHLKVHQAPKSRDFKPLGQILLERKIINEGQLLQALQNHWLSGQKLGETMVSMGIISLKQLEEILSG
jgi:diguanylate cyclase (GGDEF)-like protein